VQLFVLRHGEAESYAAKDSSRLLTEEGRRDVAQVITKNMPQLERIAQIIVSPYVRAQQTSIIVKELIEQQTGRSIELETSDLLTPDSNHREIIPLLEARAVDSVLIVSHQPLVGTLIDWLCDLEPGRYRMGTSGLASIKLDVLAPGCGQLNWLHHPFD